MTADRTASLAVPDQQGPPTLPDALTLGPVSLTVTDLDRSVGFYEQAIGLQTLERREGVARLGAGGEVLVELHADPRAERAGRHAGLYHFALLHPSRVELGRAVARLAPARVPIQGASDHGISEAIYLPDPDGNGIELAADRGRERWGDLRDPITVGPAPLDLDGLLADVAGEPVSDRAHDDLRVGHVHLHVGDLDRALAFYRDVVGFEVMTLMSSAAFVAAGGYHHHLGMNTWRGEGVPAPPPGRVGLRHWTVRLPQPSDVEAVRARVDAAGIAATDLAGGFEVADPWATVTRIVAAPTPR